MIKRGELYKIMSNYTEREEFRLSLTSNYGGDPIPLSVLSEFWDYLNEDIPFNDDRKDNKEVEEAVNGFINGTQGVLSVYRRSAIMTAKVIPGDQIDLLEDFTATCMKVSSEGAIFLFDQTIRDGRMNSEDTNKGGYEKSELRKNLQDWVTDLIPPEIYMQLKKFDNGDLFRLPWAGEIFDAEYLKDRDWVDPDGRTQWPAMKDVHRRIAADPIDGLTDNYWIMNRYAGSSTHFCNVDRDGLAGGWGASGSVGVRPAFLIG